METTLSDGVYSPLMVSIINDTLTLTMKNGTLRLGKQSTKWLNEALLLVWQTAYAEEQALEHSGEIVLRVHSRFPFTYITGKQTSLTLSHDLLRKLLMWLPVAK